MDGTCEGNPNPNSLTEDLLIEILLWLPVVSLLRFKVVCKYWRSIIESSDFIHRHATFRSSTSKLGNFIFQYRPKHIDYKPHFFVLSSSTSGGGEEDYGQWSYKNLGMSPHLSEENEHDMYVTHPPQANMVGSCHGIICIHDPHPRDIILWNPATKKFRCLPKSLPLLEEFGVLKSEFVLFGFDCETHDYKVLQISFFKIDNQVDITPRNKIQIYSLNSDSWRWCMDANLYGHSYKTKCENQGRYLNGSYYFLGSNFIRKQRIRMTDSVPYWYGDPEAVVLSFNFSRESFRMIPGPWENLVLDVIGGDQGKIVCIKVEHTVTSDVCEMCALNDYDYNNGATNADNNEYSWSKLHTFTINYSHSGYGTKAITKNGAFGFLCDIGGGLVFINFLTEEIKDIEIIDAPLEGLGDVFRGDVYKESLVSIDCAVPSSSSSYLK
ncbi:F-box/kelch-repeat protein At3g23880-like [Papaver somniferum]|uniref:F-box/kelch-repeat protein At3g23880-like n=1 Tax=Papaver somniferum TaxID=3469 RepID=UPI000E702485|nr:F-box/kelch-repeat protein At3g23880-like [Papaver somniferum]XP_026426496.1 F-box/kelch-repeat protein At3g23880-like [Papaver somniferum]XP_026426497.1 F-box/kelch-repeat protein At3g23880-like [Papaver somniferum]XP_026426498.1 F-box/kelch-repeat protein At3g23880-like [Papaver somniferum]